jgi:hypothetical protein
LCDSRSAFSAIRNFPHFPQSEIFRIFRNPKLSAFSAIRNYPYFLRSEIFCICSAIFASGDFFQLTGIAEQCDVLSKSLARFESRIFPGNIPRQSRKNKLIRPLQECAGQDLAAYGGCDPNFAGVLEELTLYLENDTDCSRHPYLNTDESCEEPMLNKSY